MLRRAMSLLGKSKPAAPMADDAFRDRFLQAIVAAEPNLEIEVTGPLSFVVDPHHEQPHAVDLTQIRSVYDLDPTRLETLVSLHTSATLQLLSVGAANLSTEMLVPLLRTRADMAAIDPPAGQPEPVNDDLVAVYALDLPGDLALVDDGHLLLLGLQPDDLASHAATGMDQLIDAAQIDVEDGVAAITADGGNASSFVFSIALWEQGVFAELENIAVIAPERDLLLAFDPADQVAADNAFAIAQEVFAASEAPLSLLRLIVKGVDMTQAEAPEPEPQVQPEPEPAPAPIAAAPRTFTRAAAPSPAPVAPPPAVAQAPMKVEPPPASTIPARAPRVAVEPPAPARAPAMSKPVAEAPAAPAAAPAPRGNSIRQLAANLKRTG